VRVVGEGGAAGVVEVDPSARGFADGEPQFLGGEAEGVEGGRVGAFAEVGAVEVGGLADFGAAQADLALGGEGFVGAMRRSRTGLTVPSRR
jgi:hypothetical protein